MTDSKQKQILSRNLRMLLEERGISQRELARAIHEKPTTINSWYIGKSLPRMDRLAKIADFFHVKYTDLIDEPIDLNKDIEDESKLLRNYRILNKSGKELAQLQLKNLTEIPSYVDSTVIQFTPNNSYSDLAAAHDEPNDGNYTPEQIAEFDRIDLEETARIDQELHNKND